MMMMMMMMMMIVMVLVGIVGVVSCDASPVRVSPQASIHERLIAAYSLLKHSPLIDGHNDMPWNVRELLQNRLHSFNLSSDLTIQEPWRTSHFSHTDLPRLRKGHVAAQFWSVRVPCDAQYLNTVQVLLEQVDVVKRMIMAAGGNTVLAQSSQEVVKLFDRGIMSSLMGVEGGHGLAGSMGVVRSLYDLGVRYITLTHNCHTPWAESAEANGVPANTRGLTPYGREMIREMNRVGVMIDLSHTSAATSRDVLATSRSPVIYSHAAARALCNNPRNIPNDVINSLVDNGGLIMISFSPELLTCGGPANIADVVTHINHVRSMAGVDYVGIGAGYDGFNSTPKGLPDVTCYPQLFAELLRDATWSLQDLKKLAGLNLLRVMARVEQVRDELSGEVPSEEIIPIHDIDSRWPCRYRFASLPPITDT